MGTDQPFAGRRTAVYLRQAYPDREALAAQEGACRARCAGMGLRVVGVYAATHVAGPRPDRPEWARLVADVRAGLVEVVVVTNLDRLLRSSDSMGLFAEMSGMSLVLSADEPMR